MCFFCAVEFPALVRVLGAVTTATTSVLISMVTKTTLEYLAPPRTTGVVLPHLYRRWVVHRETIETRMSPPSPTHLLVFQGFSTILALVLGGLNRLSMVNPSPECWGRATVVFRRGPRHSRRVVVTMPSDTDGEECCRGRLSSHKLPPGRSTKKNT